MYRNDADKFYFLFPVSTVKEKYSKEEILDAKVVGGGGVPQRHDIKHPKVPVCNRNSCTEDVNSVMIRWRM